MNQKMNEVIAKNTTLFPLVATIVIVLLWTGCEDNFKKLADNDKYAYSMNGSLDLHADTQWVRVMPIGETLIPQSPEANNVTVMLTRIQTGETTTLNDSLFSLGGEARVWNYWTTMPLHPNEDYTVLAEGSAGTVSATVTIPSLLPVPVVEIQNEGATRGVVKGSSKTPLVTADLKFYYRLTSFGKTTGIHELAVSHTNRSKRNSNGEYQFKFDTIPTMYDEIGRYPDDLEGYIIEKIQVLVATGTGDWPDYSDLSEEEAVLTSSISNVENGTGYVAGIASRKVPLESCYDEQENLTPCEEV